MNIVVMPAAVCKSPRPELGEIKYLVSTNGHRLTVHMKHNRVITETGVEVNLTDAESDLLRCLAGQEGLVVTKKMSMNHLYPSRTDRPQEKIIDVFCCKLREKLAYATGGQYFISTIRCRGYHITIPEGDLTPIGDGTGIRESRRCQSGLSATGNVSAITTPCGFVLNLRDLHNLRKPNVWWTHYRKLALVLALKYGLISLKTAQQDFKLSATELREWYRLTRRLSIKKMADVKWQWLR